MRSNTKQKQEPPPRFETSPKRVACIEQVINAVVDAGRGIALDGFDDEDSLRALAKHLGLPYLAVQLSRFGFTGLTEADVEEYNTWRAALQRKGAVR